jgi:Tat protein secretion system quality control protein TatD with DNase activity
VVGLGETGFDCITKILRIYALQLECFDRHVRLAQKHDKPLVIHIRMHEQSFYRMWNREGLMVCQLWFIVSPKMLILLRL